MDWYVGLLLIALGILFYVLYDRGYLPIKSMHAIHFVGNMGAGTNHARASFGSATGQIKRVLRFKESRSYQFHYNAKISKGTVSVYVLDTNRISQLALDSECSSGMIHGEKGKRYYLVIRFQNADGEYSLKWQ